ncbi:MAG TPA: alpha/beta fold hydrolase [Bacteroidales bacterium]|jgi:pimeloyl-ACP methyl ester carboxylesterase|nr:alpha/beta fold hydrolase [Bacteroidales bacterium]HQH24216.1 alpha/beta fold hydrolase [Bacteroidales bacterium]HQJ81840.1 alpha/beta fold hydrolase [Bacteroidales bacterium]
MKISRHITRLFIFSVFVTVFVSSCRKDTPPAYKYFISGEPAISYSEADVGRMLDLAAGIFPEIGEIKPYVASGIDVYKMVYLTEAGGKVIEASGLVCTPSVKGSYPVLSFQNGTNTRHSDAPTRKVTDVSYTLVEIMASLGFIVVLPDYPGFGSSSQIPHPYLITEPTVRSVTDMYRALNEAAGVEFPGVRAENEYYLAGYSQGGWATLALHKALETTYSAEFRLAGSVCGAGPYNIFNIFKGMTDAVTYPMPAYPAYIINAYSAYKEFSVPVSKILNEPYASLLGSLFNGTYSTGEINSRLTTSIPGLFRPELLSGLASSPYYSEIKDALLRNSIRGWKTLRPLMLAHGSGDTSVPVESTEDMYSEMIDSGTLPGICRKSVYSGLEHDEGLIPSMMEGLLFLIDIRDN